MRAQHQTPPFHGFEPRAKNAGDPSLQEILRPGRTHRLPEALKVFLEEGGPDGLQVVEQQLLGTRLLFVREILRSFEKIPWALHGSGCFPCDLRVLTSSLRISSMAIPMGAMMGERSRIGRTCGALWAMTFTNGPLLSEAMKQNARLFSVPNQSKNP